MSAVAHARPASPPVQSRPRAVAPRRQASPHLVDFAAGSAVFWVLWSALAVSADTWYWWFLVPVACWTLAFALRLLQAR